MQPILKRHNHNSIKYNRLVSFRWFMVFNAIFNNISVKLWSVLLVEETGVIVEEQQHVASNWWTSIFQLNKQWIWFNIQLMLIYESWIDIFPYFLLLHNTKNWCSCFPYIFVYPISLINKYFIVSWQLSLR
jgi:hypothetical protein